jgi:NADH dehydrogenase [ubiquinone] 1 alpha subcomplex assembly factor 7
VSLAALLKQRIKTYGALSVGDYMEQCLQHSEFGYYIRTDPFGTKGDFTTAPEISQIFGEMIGAWLATQWEKSGFAGAALVELGPGRGTLMADILRATRHARGFHDALSVHLVETSPTLKKIQWKTLAGKHANLHWHDDIRSLPPKPLLLVANEFFDALPIRQFLHSKKSGWQERVVTLDSKGEFAFSMIAAKPPAAIKSLPYSDELYEHSQASADVMQHISKHIAKYGGVALIIDYAYLQGTHGDTLQAVKSHNFYDVLRDPGTADISAHVDFKELARIAQSCGAIAYPAVAQGALLLRLGAEIRLSALSQSARGEEKSTILSGFKRLTSPDAMGELFKALCITHPKQPHPDGF